MELNYLFLLVLWATLTFQLFLDRNGDGQRQPDEPGLPGVEYTLTWADGDTSSVTLGTTDADGYVNTVGTGTVTLTTPCASYSAQVDEVAGQSVIALPCVWHYVYFAQVWR